MGGESRELHRVGAGESSASTATDRNSSFLTLSTTKQRVAEIWGSKTYEDSQSICYFLPCKTQWFQIQYLVHTDFQVWFPSTAVWIFLNKYKNWVILSYLSLVQKVIKSNNFELVLSRQTCQTNHVLNYVSGNSLDSK